MYQKKAEFTTTSNVVEIQSKQQLKSVLLEAKKAGRLVVASYYTVWDSKCKGATPVIAKMSQAMTSLVWCAIDCDKQRELVRQSTFESSPAPKHLRCWVRFEFGWTGTRSRQVPHNSDI